MSKTTPQNLNRKPLTLLEIVIVLALIGVTAVFGTWSLTDFLAQHRRQVEVEELKNFLQELQIEALALQSDLEVTFSKKGEILHVCSKTPEKILRDRTVTLKDIRQLKFRDRPIEPLSLKIFSTGRIEPSGIIEIARKKETLWIDMSQPLSIKFSDKRPPIIQESIPDKPKKSIVCN